MSCNLIFTVTHIKMDVKYFSKVIAFVIQKCLQTPKEHMILFFRCQ